MNMLVLMTPLLPDTYTYTYPNIPVTIATDNFLHFLLWMIGF